MRSVRWIGSLAVVCALVCAPVSQAAASQPRSAASAWSGAWDTTFGLLVITESGSSVLGTYTYCNGSINATVSGATLRGTWYESRPCRDAGSGVPASGPFELVLQGAFSFVGRYGYSPGSWAGPWNGTRVSR